MIKAVIFDMDGLMFDTEALAVKAWKHTAEKFGLNITDKMLSEIRGIDIKHCQRIFERELGENIDFFELKASADAYMIEFSDALGVPVKDGLFELLEYIKNRGLKIALATSTENKRAIYYLNTANVLGYFNKIICGDMVENGKPDPDIYLTAVQSLGLKPEECMVLEDSPNGALAANKANCPVIIVPDLDKPDSKTKKLAFDIAENLFQVKDMLEKL